MKSLRYGTFIAACALLIVALLKAQTGQLIYMAPAGGTTVANCGTPSSGFPMCGVATGWFVWNGSAWVQIGSASGVTSITVCNAAGGSCGVAQTGPVSLSIPSKVTVTVGNPTVTATQGAVNAQLQ